MIRMVEDRKNRSASKKQGYDKALAECHNNNNTKPAAKKSSKAKGGGIQTGLHAFFKATKTVSKKEKVVDLTDEEASSTSSGASSGKRKSLSPDSGSPSKKAKSDASVKVVPGKRNSGSPVSCTPEKKLRTVVNEEGVIELVPVPR